MKKIVTSGMIGNALEWYDYALYAQFAGIIGKTFFSNSPWSELLTFAVFALGFIVRPVGAIVFSIIGDKFGRKAALSLSILSMAVPTAGIGLLPSYNNIGIIAPLALCALRLLQGLALGGEFSICISYLVEHAPPKQRGLIGSTSFVSMCIGLLLGSSTAYLMRYFINPQTLEDWVWRIPFVAGLFIGLVGLYIRMNLSESPLYLKAKEAGQLKTVPIKEVFACHLPDLLISIAIYTTVTAPFHTITVYIESFLHKTLNYTLLQATQISTLGLIVLIITMPIAAMLSDRIGRKPVLISSAGFLAIIIYPIFTAFGQQNFIVALWAQALFAFALGSYMGCIPTILVEIFPTKIRLTAVAFSYNLSAAIFGGTAPITAISLQKITNNDYAMGIYLACLATMSLVVIICFFQESYHKDLN
jgi:MHS family proline/betaine transporter-like MFS transporter